MSFTFLALPEACSLTKRYEVTVDDLEELPTWMDLSEATGDQPVLLITRDSEETVGSYVVTIKAFMGTVEASSYYQFRVNFYLEDCLRSQFTYSNVLPDFEWEIDQGLDSYSSEEIGVQQFVVDLVDTEQCASTVTYTAWVKLTPTSAEVEYTELTAPNVWRYLQYDEASMTFTAYVEDDYQPVDGTDDLDLTEIIIWGEVTHDATGDILASSQAQGWDFSVDVQVPIDERCITETLTINMSQMDINNEGGYLPDSDTEGDYLAKDVEFVNVVELAGSTIQFYPGESITLPMFDMQQDCEWELETLLQILGSPSGVDAELNGDGRPEITIDDDASAGTYTMTYSGTAVSDYDDIDNADVSYTFDV